MSSTRLRQYLLGLLTLLAAPFVSRDAGAAGSMYHLVIQLDDGLFVEPFEENASRLSVFPRIVTVVDQNGGELVHGDQLWIYRQSTGEIDRSVSYRIWNSDNDPGRLKLGGRVVVGYWAADRGMWALLYRQWIERYGEDGAGWIYGDWYNTTRPKLIGLFAAD